MSLPSITRASIPPWKERIMFANLAGQPIFARMAHKPSLLTVSKALVGSINIRNRSLCCSIHFSWSCRSKKIMSMVDRPARKPHWLSGSMPVDVTWSDSLISMVRARTLPATVQKAMLFHGGCHSLCDHLSFCRGALRMHLWMPVAVLWRHIHTLLYCVVMGWTQVPLKALACGNRGDSHPPIASKTHYKWV